MKKKKNDPICFNIKGLVYMNGNIKNTRCAYHGVRNVRFSENLECFVFLKHLFLDSLFCLTTSDMMVTFLKKELSKSVFLEN